MLYIQQLGLLLPVNMCCPQDCFVLVAAADCSRVKKNVDVGGCITGKPLWAAQLPALACIFRLFLWSLGFLSHMYTHLISMQLYSHSHTSSSTAAQVFWGTPMTSE